MKGKLVLYLGLFLAVAACIDPFTIPAISFDKGLLVVEGFINSGGGASTFRLTHTEELKDEKPGVLPELKASVVVEGSDNSSYKVSEKGNGTYSTLLTAIDPLKQYRVRIKTSAGKEYVSDFVAVRQAPSIDSITWTLDRAKNGIQFYVNAHDEKNKTTYYQWEYSETWQYNADCNNPLDVVSKYTCWMTRGSTDIYTASSAKLSADVIAHFPLGFIDANSEKPNVAYSLLVKQYAVSKSEFEYLQAMKKNTEQLGSIFDALPSQVQGNIRCITNPDEPVLGYVSAHSVAEQRIFIFNYKLPNWVYRIPSWFICPPPEDVPCSPSPICADCTRRGGTNIKPDFWVY